MADYLLTVKRVYRRDQGANLESAITTTWTDGNALTLENVVDFDPKGGIGVFEPGTARAEIFQYGGVSEQLEQLTGVVRPNTKFNHGAGTFVQEGETATTSMLVDGYFEDEERPVVGIPVPPELEMTLALGVRTAESMEIIPVALDDDEDEYVSGAAIGTPLVLRTDDDGVKLDTARDSMTIGKNGLFELVDVAGAPPAGTAGRATVFYDSLGAGGAGLYGRFGTGTVTLIKAF